MLCEKDDLIILIPACVEMVALVALVQHVPQQVRYR